MREECKHHWKRQRFLAGELHQGGGLVLLRLSEGLHRDPVTFNLYPKQAAVILIGKPLGAVTVYMSNLSAGHKATPQPNRAKPPVKSLKPRGVPSGVLYLAQGAAVIQFLLAVAAAVGPWVQRA